MIGLLKCAFSICSIFLLTSIQCHAQYHDNVWTFGYFSTHCDSTEGFGGSNLIFDDDIVTSEFHCRDIRFGGNLTSSISDSEGNLKLMFNGCTMNDADHNIVAGSEELVRNDTSIEQDWWCVDGYNSPQSAVFLPDPYDEDRYYLFYRDLIQIDEQPYVLSDSFYIASILFENDIPYVEYKDAIIQDTVSITGSSAIRHANGIDWWVMVKNQSGSVFHSILLDENGVSETLTQDVGNLDYIFGNGHTTKSSPDGNYMASFDPDIGLEILSFDRANGSFSEYIFVPSWLDILETNILDIEFSPSGQYLYVADIDTLYQFDMTADAEDFYSTKTIVGIYDGFVDVFPVNFWLMQTARDGKIYMSARNSSKFLHVIHAPDEAGLDCDFRQHDFELPTVNAFAMPYFPNFRLGADSTYVSTLETIEKTSYTIYPNPATDRITVKGDRYDAARICDIYGSRVMTSTERSIDVSSLQSGIYIIQFYKGNELSATHKFIKI